MSSATRWLAFILALEIVSALTIFHPYAQTIVLSVASVGMFVLAWRKPGLAASFLLVEYVIGSKGALLRAGGDGIGHGGVPLRIAWFAAFFLGWLIWAIQNRTYRDWLGYLKGRSVYVCLGLILAYAFIRGWFLGNPFLLEDANGWGIWLLLLPALDLAHHKKDELQRFVPSALLVAGIWMMTKTLVLFYLFSHLTNKAWLDAIYLWVRRTGVGEITRALPNANAWRVFFQSHIYVLPAVIGGGWYALTQTRLSRFFWVFWISAWATAIVSLSRSLAIGIGFGLLVSAVLLFVKNDGFRLSFVIPEKVIFVRACTRVFCAAFAAFALVAALFYAPPRPVGSLTDLLASRANLSEEAAVSRWELLPVLRRAILRHPFLGSGFGATVTYPSKDPRAIATSGGMYTTYAFEWGWLEHWFKFGILGIPVLIWILGRLIWLIWRSNYQPWVRFAMIASLGGLAMTHMFTPYLNHPLGIMWLIMMEASLI